MSCLAAKSSISAITAGLPTGDDDTLCCPPISCITDNDTGSSVPPVDAARVAKAYDVKIYTIAIGDPVTVGEEALDLETIERVSEVTGGQAFQALDQDQLRQAYEVIAEMEPELYETLSFRPRQSLHYVPIALALMLFLIFHTLGAMRNWRQMRTSRAA